MPSLYQIFLLLIILFITPSLAVDFQGLPDKVKVMIFRHLKLPLDSGSPPRLTPLVPCLLVCRYWHHFLNSNVLWEDVSIEVNAKFHQFIRIPKLRIPVTIFMGAFSLVLRTEFDM